MAGVTAKVQNVGLTFEQAQAEVMDEIQSVEWIIETAREQHAEIMAMPPAPLKWRLFIDGVETNAIEAVKWNSNVRFQYSRIDMVIEYALEALRKLSPVLTGRYQNTHTLLIDGMPGTAEDWNWGEEILITNLQPYARKIEVGAMKMRVPGTDHVFQNATRFTKSRFGSLASITFSYRPLAAGVSVEQGGKTNRSDLRYPVMIITQED